MNVLLDTCALLALAAGARAEAHGRVHGQMGDPAKVAHVRIV